MTELELIIDLHLNSNRQGPGSEKDTLRALEMVNLPRDNEWNIADLGCGTGGQTITLARALKGRITAVDLFPEFLNELEKRVLQSGFADRITTLEASMSDLSFEKGAYDLIWSEGAIYNIGFETGIQQWRDYLKDGGYLAVTEITWITPSRPREIEDFWKSEYPEIDLASNKIVQLEQHGYALAGYFYLDHESWLVHYYQSLEARFEPFLKRHHHSEPARKVVDDYRTEIALYRKYKDYYSYGFYVARKC